MRYRTPQYVAGYRQSMSDALDTLNEFALTNHDALVSEGECFMNGFQCGIELVRSKVKPLIEPLCSKVKPSGLYRVGYRDALNELRILLSIIPGECPADDADDWIRGFTTTVNLIERLR